MQPGGGAQRGGGRGRSTAGSPSSSSSAVSTPQQLRVEQQQQQQQRHQRELMQQHFAKRPEGNETIHAYQAGGIHGAGAGNFGGSASTMQLNQQPRRFDDLGQQNGSSSIREEGQNNRSHGNDQQMLNNQAYYMQYAFQAAQQKSAIGMQSQQQMMGMFNNTPGRDQDTRMGSMKTQEFISMQGSNQGQASSSRKSTDRFVGNELMVDRGKQPVSAGQKADSGPPDDPATAKQSMPASQPQQHFHNTASNSMSMAAQMQAMQALALEHNIDLSVPANANMIAQLIPMMQSRMSQPQKANESNTCVQSSSAQIPRQQASSPQVANENSPHGNTSSDASGQSDSAKARQSVSTVATPVATPSASTMNNSSNIPAQQYSLARENQMHLRHPIVSAGNAMPTVPFVQQSNSNLNQGVDSLLFNKGSKMNSEALRMQHNQQISRSSPQPKNSANNGVQGALPPSQGGSVAQQSQQSCLGFTKQQLHVLKAQILAFRRIKKGDSFLPRDILQAISPPPLVIETQQVLQSARMVNQDNSVSKSVEEHSKHFETSEKGKHVLSQDEETHHAKQDVAGADSVVASSVNLQVHASGTKEPAPALPTHKEEQDNIGSSCKPDPEAERGMQKLHTSADFAADKGKAVVSQVTIPDAMQNKVPLQGNMAVQSKDLGSTRKYHGPLFDFPVFTRKHDTLGSSLMASSNNNFTLAYDIKDILAEEGVEVAKRKREEKIQKISDILAVNLERKRIRPDLVLRLQIEEKKLQLANVQTRMRLEIEQQQQDIMAMPERPYRKFVRLCERQRRELNRQVQASQKAIRDKQLKAIFLWRKKLLESHWAIRDARTARNRGVAKYHEKMLREFSKLKDDDRSKRMEALKNNDVERYREMLLEQQTSISGEAAERYAVLSSFLSQTEDYLHRLGSKITSTKNQQEVEEAAIAAAVAARVQGLSEEEARAAAACAREEVIIRNRFSEMNAPKDGSSVNKYYHLAHAINETVIRQPSMLRAGTLRDYQLVGLQWMLSLYNNKLNGILADEMGLGKTVQVMALIAYLMEFKGNYGPHLIIVPNAVLVNWKSELHTWLPSVSCIYYVGAKDQRSKLFTQEVLAMKFNVLVTTYEFIMYDRTKLSKVDWRYIVIDEAQRMKDRESVLARDLDKYRCQRRLLLTGTPLQNDLKELWSLLNLLLPDVFDNRKAFHDWFSQPFQKEGPSHNSEDDWLETEKKVIIIHRLHQILEPFMLRRRVEDVEGSLPPKVSIVLKCRMSAIQSAIYDWVKTTGTIRLDPEDENRIVQKKPHYHPKTYRILNNRCMELRKTCNHPLLNYPYFSDLSKDFLVRSCGKLWILDRILIKLQRTGHRVLLFSTMTKLLDLLEEYLQWRRLVYRRIDGTTSLEDRESAIVEFNSPGTDCFIFLLSIRAAGRGLNLQSADTVVIYDPDPNPKNEEQAVARAHRIGQTREVKVIYLEAVVDSISSHQKEDEFQSSGAVEDSDDDLVGKDRYMGSIESLIRNNIQQYKIEMADEVINAGRFDQRTTHEERRLTLETLLHDEERYQETVHDVPSLQEVNRMIARSEEEVELFDQMDEELDWADELTRYDQVPDWLRANTREVNETMAKLSKKPSKNGLDDMDSKDAPSETRKRRGRPKGKKVPVYAELDDESGDLSEASSEEKIAESAPEEEGGDIEETEDEEFDGGAAARAPSSNKEQSEEDTPLPTHGYVYSRALNSTKDAHKAEEPGSSGSSSGGRRVMQVVSTSMSSQKFGYLSSLEARPTSHSKKLTDDLEEGEIAVSGESHLYVQQSGSWNQDRDEGEDEQVLQPKIKRKRSIRLRPRLVADRSEDKFNDLPSARRVDSLRLPNQVDRNRVVQPNIERGHKNIVEHTSLKQDLMNSSVKNKRNMNSHKLANSTKLQSSLRSGRSNSNLSNSDDALPQSKDISDSKVLNASGTSSSTGFKMPEVILKKCKNVISRLQKRIDREGPQIIPLLSGLWKKIENSGGISGKDGHLFDLPEINTRLDNHEYNGVMQFVSDVLLMLRISMQYYGFSHEVRSEARKVHDLFFDILKILFPDIDFRDLKNSLSFGTPSSATPYYGSSSKQTLPVVPVQNKPMKKDVEHELNRLQKPHIRGPNSEDTKPRGQTTTTTRVESHHAFAHPGELVICKKKRKDREKVSSLLKPGGGGSGSGSGGCGPVSPINRVMRSPPPGLGSVIKTSQQQVVIGNDGNVGWANPVKRLRTGAGKRRPTNL